MPIFSEKSLFIGNVDECLAFFVASCISRFGESTCRASWPLEIQGLLAKMAYSGLDVFPQDTKRKKEKKKEDLLCMRFTCSGN